MNTEQDLDELSDGAVEIDKPSAEVWPNSIRKPVPEDGPAVHRLIAACPPLDTNSLYCNLLQCSHFAETCAVAERSGEIMGFVSGYVKPNDPQTLFIWQVAVSEAARGLGLARALILHILARPVCRAVNRIETTITGDNDASWAMFGSLARSLSAPSSRSPLFDRDIHLEGRHPSEHLLRIGPFTQTMKELI